MLKIILAFFLIIFVTFGYSAPNYLKNPSIVSGKIYLEAQIKNKVLIPNYTVQNITFQWYQLKNGDLQASFLCNDKIIEIMFTKNELIAASKKQISNKTKSKINNACMPPGNGGPAQ